MSEVAALPGAAGALAEQVQALAADAEQVLRELGREQLAQDVREELARPAAGVATIVVVGETNRGKSALVNALLELPGLSPVDSDIATNCYVEIRHADAPYARVSVAGESEPLAIDVGEIADWATVRGNPGNEKGVRSVEVGLPNPFLKGMRLIDTPGVGGLEAAHGQLTLEVLREAQALLFVIDTDGPLSSPELRFLERAAQRIDTVIIALTKIDTERHWEELRSADAALLREHAPRFAGAPIVPVSSTRLEQSLGLEDGARAQRRRAGSGVDALAELIRARVVRRAAVLHLANATHVCHGALTAVAGGLAERLAAVEHDPSFEQQLKDKQERLVALEDELNEWQDRLTAELELMALERTRELTGAIRNLQREYLKRVEKTKKSEQPQLIVDLENELSALARRLAHQSAERLARTLEELLGITGDEQALSGPAGRLVEEIGGVPMAEEPTGGQLGAADKMAVAGGFLMGARLPTVAGMILPGVAGPAGVVVAGAGVVWMALSGRSRKRALDQAELRTWIRDQLGEATSYLRDDFSARMIAVRQEIKRINRRQVAERKKELAAAQKEYRDAAAASVGERDRRRRQLSGQSSKVEGLLAAATRLQASFATVGAPEPERSSESVA